MGDCREVEYFDSYFLLTTIFYKPHIDSILSSTGPKVSAPPTPRGTCAVRNGVTDVDGPFDGLTWKKVPDHVPSKKDHGDISWAHMAQIFLTSVSKDMIKNLCS